MTTSMDIPTESFLRSPYKENYLYSINRNSFNKEPSTSVFHRIYKEKLEQERTFYIVLGTDSGLLLSHILTLDKQDDTRYLFIELPHVITLIKEKFDFANLPEHIRITTLEEWQDEAVDFGIELYLFKDQATYIKSVAAIDSYLPDYDNAILTFEQEYQSLRFFTRATLAVSPFMGSQLANICENRIPALALKKQFEGYTCMLLAGGPSLDEDIEWVINNRENLVVMAASRIAKRLLQVNLIPDIIVSVDPFEISFDVSKELLQLPKDVLFLHTNNVAPRLLAQWHGRSSYLDRRYPWDVKGDTDNLMSTGPTVTNCALKAAIDLGFSDILLSGVDLCFSKQGVTHASGSNEAKVGPTLGQSGKWVETYAGNTVETLVVFERAAEGLSELALTAKDEGISIYNLSENAAVIKHISHVPTNALSFTPLDINFQTKLNQLLPVENRDKIVTNIKEVKRRVNKTLSNIKDIKRLTQKALNANTELFREKGKETENFKHKLQMDKIEKKLDSTYKLTAKFIKNFGIDKFIKSAQVQTSDEWSDEKVEMTGRLYYQAYIDTCQTLTKLLEQTLERIDSRLEEYSKAPDIDALLAQWRKDRCYGRAGVWRENPHKKVAIIPEGEEKKLITFDEKFAEILANEDTKHLARTKTDASLKGVRRKIITLFHQRNGKALKTLSDSLHAHQNIQDDSEELYHLCMAYLAIAMEEEVKALEFFELLPKEKIHEDELQQITAIALKLKNYDLAKACLNQLIDIAAVYIPQYAKLLYLLGQPNEAVDAYTQYLGRHPDNIFVWHHLATLYIDIGSLEAAKLAYEAILEQDPENAQAKMAIAQLPVD